jgi:predicted HTH transcriptional regulator
VVIKLSTQNNYTRSELEALTGNSKTSMVRLLAEWSKDDLITKNGSGKNVNYKLSKKLVESIQQSGASI